MSDSGIYNELLSTIEPVGTNGEFRIGIVTAFDTASASATIRLGGSSYAIAGVKVMDPYIPAVNDVVLVGKFGPSLVILGAIGKADIAHRSLTLYGTGSAVPLTISTGGNDSIAFAKTGGNTEKHTFYDGSNVGFRFWDGTSSLANLVIFDTAANNYAIQVGVAMMGERAYANHAEFSHSSLFGSTSQYGILHKNQGDIYINGATHDTSTIFMLSNNSVILQQFRYVAGSSAQEWKAFALPVVGGTTLSRNGTSNQVGLLTSSARYKENIKPLAAGVANPIFRLNPVRFDWKKDVQDRSPGETTVGVAGLIAEEVDQIVPEAVNHAKDAEGKTVAESLNVYPLLGLLVDAVKYLKASNDNLSQRNQALEARLVAVESKTKNLPIIP